ncbi:hypothetical protein Bca52824_075419 [Brassica carinata]|uniref:PUB domain-containing protein n=1 Tax=Brassica carinata TaxID=52824 RepID=A0A8X7TVE2_BRACI|nr:hypothetical protein Bca52824_075419 [Brassica carinata]
MASLSVSVCHYSYSACGLGSNGTDRLVQLVQGMQHNNSKSEDGTLYGAKITEAVKNRLSRSRNRDRDVDLDFGEKFGEKEDVEIQGERRPLQKRKGFIVRSCSSIRHARSPRLRTYLKTSIDEGVDEDFRKIRMSNSNIKEAIGDVAEGIEFLF